MTSMNSYADGQFSWIDIMTPDLRASRNFYSELFDWDSVDNPTDQGSVYVEFQFDGRAVAGMGEMPERIRMSGAPAAWSSYVNVESVARSVALAEGLGASIEMPPMQVMNAGQMAIIADPVGAQLSLWQPEEHIGAGLVNEPTSLCWNELATTDIESAIRFYSGLFGWQFENLGQPDSIYYEIINDQCSNGGVIEMNEEWEDIPPHWMPYVSVFDCDATLEKAAKLGAIVEAEPIDAQSGRFSVIEDPLGAVITVMALNDPE